MTIIGIVLFLFANSTSPIWYVILAHIVMMIGVPLSMSPSQTFGLSALDQRTSSDGSTIMNTFQQIVGAIATAIATALLGFGQQLSATTHQIAFTNGVHLGFIFTLIIAVAALLLSLTMKERKIN
jgi:DHA2 family lincomycin resistance protein-like MFS transporter